MEFIQHTFTWCRGEIFEGRMLALFGVVIIALALIFWRLGSTPAARAMYVPLLVVGTLALFVGLTMSFNNQVRINTYSAAFSENPDAFVQAERERTEAFIKWYPYTMYSFSVIIILGLGVFPLSLSGSR